MNSQTDENIKNKFLRCDSNKKGYLIFDEFLEFVKVTLSQWEPLYKFREVCVEYVFPNKHYINILNRRLEIKKITSYLESHKKFPPESCLNIINRKIKSIPPMYKFDYYCDLFNITYDDIISIVTKQIKQSTNTPLFSLRYLETFINYPASYEIDIFYVKFIKEYNQQHKSNRSEPQSYSEDTLNK